MDEKHLHSLNLISKIFIQIKSNRKYLVTGFCRTQASKSRNWDELRILVAPLDKPDIYYAIHAQDFFKEYKEK